jgi:hypothetical protein
MRADCLPKVSVAVHVNGNALHEYHAESESEHANTAVCYVEAVSGAEFSLVLAIEPGYAHLKDDLQFRIFLDGNPARSQIVNPPKQKGNCTIATDSVRRYEDGYSHYRKFTFAPHETSTCHVPTCRENSANA